MILEASNWTREAGAAFDRAAAVGSEAPEAGQGERDWRAHTAHGGRHPTPTRRCSRVRRFRRHPQLSR